MRTGVLGLVVVLIAAGCASQAPGPPQPTQVEYPKVEAPKDRDERAVVAALRGLDACGLLDPIDGTKPAAEAPHRCATVGDDSIRVTLGVRFDRQDKYRAVPLDLGGAKAYLDTSEPGDDSCQVAIPVSFALTITVVGRQGPRSGPGDICVPTKSAAMVAASRLANPPARSATGWTACELFVAVAGDVLPESDDIHGVDVCRARERTPHQRLLFRVNLEYGDDPVKGAKEVRTVAGQPVAVSSDGSGCLFRWSAGPIRVGFQAYDCAKGEPLLPGLITTLASPNPDRTSPQQPLQIGPDEPDEPLVGACVDYYPHGLSCQPSTDMPVPQGAQSALTAADQDARVACALAKDAVRAGFGPALTPVLGSLSTERPNCYFVEPDHTVVVEVLVRPNYGLTDGQDLTVSGRPAKLLSTGNDRHLCLLPVSGAKTGVLCVIAHFLPGRGKETDAPADTSKAAKLEPAVTEIVSRYFS